MSQLSSLNPVIYIFTDILRLFGQHTSTNGLLGGFVFSNPVLERRLPIAGFSKCGPNGICFVGLEGGVPNGDIELLFSLLASGELTSWRLLCANFFLRACAIIEAGSLPSAGRGVFLRGVPPGDLSTDLSLTFPRPLRTSAMFGKLHPDEVSVEFRHISGARDNRLALFSLMICDTGFKGVDASVGGGGGGGGGGGRGGTGAPAGVKVVPTETWLCGLATIIIAI